MKEFTLEGTTFRVDKLKVKASLKGLKLVGGVILPAMAEAKSAPAGQIGNAMQRAIDSLDNLPDLLDLFAPVTKYTSESRPNPTELGPFIENVFGGRSDLLLLYLYECVSGEYSNYFLGSGPLASLLQQVMGSEAPPPDGSTSPKTT